MRSLGEVSERVLIGWKGLGEVFLIVVERFMGDCLQHNSGNSSNLTILALTKGQMPETTRFHFKIAFSWSTAQ